jgi:hypothetical protein
VRGSHFGLNKSGAQQAWQVGKSDFAIADIGASSWNANPHPSDLVHDDSISSLQRHKLSSWQQQCMACERCSRLRACTRRGVELQSVVNVAMEWSRTLSMVQWGNNEQCLRTRQPVLLVIMMMQLCVRYLSCRPPCRVDHLVTSMQRDERMASRGKATPGSR